MFLILILLSWYELLTHKKDKMFNFKGIEVGNRYWKHNLISLRTEYSIIQNGSIQRTTWKCGMR